jgi:hypothetical protein
MQQLLLVQSARSAPSPLMLASISVMQQITEEHLQLLAAFQSGRRSDSAQGGR